MLSISNSMLSAVAQLFLILQYVCSVADMMFRTLLIACILALASAFTAPVMPSKLSMSKVSMNGGKGFGGGEATRDPEPTEIDPNDPKGKQQAIHKAESFAEYLARRQREQGQ
uniref:Uncharacterized protein n=1 Tax=Chrysotila carterae TaxID=13221 RepID=A0A7S4BJP5_CHRCT